MMLYRLLDWLRPERIVGSTPFVWRTNELPVGRLAFNERDETWVVYSRRWRWSR